MSFLAQGLVISNTSSWCEDATQVYSKKRFVDESGIRKRYERYIAKAVIDGTINNTPISFDAIYSVCALPEPSKNTELFNLIYTLNEEKRGCIKQEWGNLRWNNYYPRCRRCFCPGLCYSSTIPSIYELGQVQWGDRCVIWHTKKQHHNYYLCGSAYCMFNFITIIKPTIIPSIRTVRDGLLFCEPNPIPLIWLGYKCNYV